MTDYPPMGLLQRARNEGSTRLGMSGRRWPRSPWSLLGLGRTRPLRRVAGVLIAASIFIGILPPHRDAIAAVTPTFVQSRANQVTSGSTNSLAFSSANTAGNLIVVYVLWSNTGAVSLSDSRGNSYASAVGRTTWGSNGSAQIFYAKNVAAGANTVTATFATAISSFGDIYIHEYSGADKVDPVDVTRSATGTSSAMSSGPVATTYATDLLFAAAGSSRTVKKGDSRYTTRSTAFGNRTQDRNVSTIGSYDATATQNGTAWVMQLVAFKADSVADTTPPTVSVTAPTAGATVSATVTVAADAADNIGVAGVQFGLDGANLGAEDTSSPYSVSWDTTTATNGSHSLTARARDAAGNTTTSSAVIVTVSNDTGPPPGLAAGYAFDEGAGTTAADASGHGLTGTLTYGPTWTTGKYGTAVNLDGSDDYVNLGNPPALQITGSMTISAWIHAAGFPADDAAVVSKRGGTTPIGYQLDTTVDRGPRTIGFKLSTSSGGEMTRYGATALQTNTWYHVTGVYNASARTLDVYLNGQPDNGALVGTVTSSQQNSTANVTIGRRASGGYQFNGRIDDARIYDRVLSQAEIQSDMNTALVAGGSSDPTPPTVSITSPADNAQVSGIVNVTASASDNVGVTGVQVYVDGVSTGPEDHGPPYGLAWDTRTVPNGAHTLTVRARDAAGNGTFSAPVTVNVANTSYFQNEILATGLNLPVSTAFLPDGRMLVVELGGTIKILPPPYTQPNPTPFLQLTNVASAGVSQGVYDFAFDPDFANNHYYYIFYTMATPNRDRLSRFTANATNTGTVTGSETVIYQDPQDAGLEHHGGAITFGNDGKIYFTTGDHLTAGDAQLLTSPHGKIHRVNKDGTIPTDNPFYDGAGPNVDSIWARGLRNPFRAYFDAPTGRLLVGDVGGNNPSTAVEEVDLGTRGANYGWPNSEGPCAAPCTSPIYSYPHNGRDASITGGFVYHGSQYPSSYQGSYFFADYAQNWIRRLTFDASGNVTGVVDFEPIDGSIDGPYGDIVHLTEGPDGALYYVDLGYSDVTHSSGLSKIRRIRFVSGNLAPVAVASASPTSGPTPLTVNFSSAGSVDPEGQPLTYAWTFGDGSTSSAANPAHTYAQAGQYTARLAVSDGVNTTQATPLFISAGNPPTATILSPQDGSTFRAGDVISFSGDASDPEDGSLPASAYTWNIDFLHEGHVHPGAPQTGIKGGTFTIPTSGHDFSGNTRYRIMLTVTDSSGLTDTKSVTIYPQKVNLTFGTTPSGLTLYLDGIAEATPFMLDTLIGFNHTIEARNQSSGSNSYTFQSWSDGGAQEHTIVVPSTDQSYTATYSVSSAPPPVAFVQVNSAVPQTPQSTVATTFSLAQAAGNLNVAVVGWNESIGNITSVTDSAGNAYQLAVPTFRGTGLSQAIYYAKDIAGAGPGNNTVTVTFDKAVNFADVRILEYGGLDQAGPFDVGRSAAGSSATADSGAVTTSFGRELVVGAGITVGCFSGAGSGFTARIITNPDCDIVEDRTVTTTGSYNATAPANATWVMQVATFKAAGQ
jgi:glucose/arabinose dehydrogenase